MTVDERTVEELELDRDDRRSPTGNLGSREPGRMEMDENVVNEFFGTGLALVITKPKVVADLADRESKRSFDAPIAGRLDCADYDT